jgi:hypothetical protein
MLPSSALFMVESLPLNSMFFGLCLIIEGAAEKVSQFTMPRKSIYHEINCFKEKKEQKQLKMFKITLNLG